MGCSVDCEHLRSFRYGFDGSKIFAPFDKRDRVAGCALNPEVELHMRSYPVCWREAETSTVKESTWQRSG